MASKSKDELLRIITGRNPDTLDHQYAQIELEKRKSSCNKNMTSDKSTTPSNNKDNWYQKPLGIIAMSVISGVLVIFVIWVISHYLSLSLK